MTVDIFGKKVEKNYFFLIIEKCKYLERWINISHKNSCIKNCFLSYMKIFELLLVFCH